LFVIRFVVGPLSGRISFGVLVGSTQFNSHHKLAANSIYPKAEKETTIISWIIISLLVVIKFMAQIQIEGKLS